MIELYTVDTANGQKVQVTLEEAGAPYRATRIDLQAGEHRTDAFLALSPFGKAPVMVDPDGPDGAPLVLAETLAMCWYAAGKGDGGLLPQGPRETAEAMMWAAAISSSVATPFALQFIAQVLAPEPMPWLEARAVEGCRQMLGAFEARLAGRAFVGGERFGVLDCLFYPVVATSAKRLQGWLEPYPALARYAERVGARPAVQRGMAADAGAA